MNRPAIEARLTAVGRAAERARRCARCTHYHDGRCAGHEAPLCVSFETIANRDGSLDPTTGPAAGFDDDREVR